MREGAFRYFSAPFDASELAEMVRAAMPLTSKKLRSSKQI